MVIRSPRGLIPASPCTCARGAVQAFEFTFELAVKMLRRYLVLTEPNPAEIPELSFNELIRLASARGLTREELVEWKAFRRDRGTTSHTYDEAKALEVFNSIPPFLCEARFVLEALIERLAKVP